MEPQLTFSALFQEVFKDKMIAAKLFEPYSSGDSVFFMKLLYKISVQRRRSEVNFFTIFIFRLYLKSFATNSTENIYIVDSLELHVF